MDVDRKALSNVTLCSYRPAQLDPSSKSYLNEGFITDNTVSHPKHHQQRSAVEVNRVKLSYGRGKNAKAILSEINLRVPEGAM